MPAPAWPPTPHVFRPKRGFPAGRSRPCSSRTGEGGCVLTGVGMTCVCRMFGAQLSQKTTVLWGDDKKKAVKANPWVRRCRSTCIAAPSVARSAWLRGSCDRAARWSVAHARRRSVAVEVAVAGVGFADGHASAGHPLGLVLLQEDQHLPRRQVNAPRGAYIGTRSPRELLGHCRGALTPRAAKNVAARGSCQDLRKYLARVRFSSWHEARGSLYIYASCIHLPVTPGRSSCTGRGSLDSKQGRTQVSVQVSR